MPLQIHPVFLSFGPPSAELTRQAITYGQRHGFNYPFPGKLENFTSIEAATGSDKWVVDNTQIEVGSGKETYEAAKKLLQSWGQFQHDWTWVDPSTPIIKGSGVVVNAGLLNIFASCPLEVTFVKESQGTVSLITNAKKKVKSFTFASGCLQGHLLAGEERFIVEHDLESDKVTYQVLAVSRPSGPLGLLSYPVLRLLQMKFGRDSAAAVRKALIKPKGGGATGRKTSLV